MIGDIIRELRKEAGYSQTELGNKLNITASAIGMYEQNRRLPDVENLIKLAKIFDVSTDYILGIENNSKNYISKDSKFNSNYNAMKEAFFIRFIKLYNDNKLDYNNEEAFLNLTHKQISDIHTVRLPELVELQQLSTAFRVTINYLLGLPEFDLTEEEHELLEYYNNLSKINKRLIMGKIVELMTQSKFSYNDAQVAENIAYFALEKSPEQKSENSTTV